MGKLTDLSREAAAAPRSETFTPFVRKPATPFFQPTGIGHHESPQGAAQGGNEGAPSKPSEASPVTRAQRLKGGIPANRLAKALVAVLPTIKAAPKKELLGEVSRGARLPVETWAEIEALAGNQRGMPEWVRAAINFVAENQVPAEVLKSAAAEIQRRRESEGRGRTISVALGSVVKQTTEELAKRSNLSEQGVLEGAIELYRLAHVQALAEDAPEGESR
jgi:hypothetical protein